MFYPTHPDGTIITGHRMVCTYFVQFTHIGLSEGSGQFCCARFPPQALHISSRVHSRLKWPNCQHLLHWMMLTAPNDVFVRISHLFSPPICTIRSARGRLQRRNLYMVGAHQSSYHTFFSILKWTPGVMLFEIRKSCSARCMSISVGSAMF